tara:strand:+ start:170 stop:505 length:336 start_codon:yes stop_codon:yes gene_type:complete
MPMLIVMQLNGLITVLYSQALVLHKALLYKLVNNLRVNYILASLSVVSLWNLPVKTLLNFKALLANLITQAQLIKVELKLVAITSGQTGQQLLTTARQTHQRALNLQRQEL